MNYWKKPLAAALLIGLQLPVFASGIPVKLYKNPQCGCCDVYADHLNANGFKVEIVNTEDMTSVKKKFGVPEQLEGCHTATIKGYVLEGLIPAQHIKRLLTERPSVKGLSVPGMPVGAPGMPGNKKGPIHVHTLEAAGKSKIYASF